jgi:hypothetical protein
MIRHDPRLMKGINDRPALKAHGMALQSAITACFQPQQPQQQEEGEQEGEQEGK